MDELTPDEMKRQVNEAYPDLAGFIGRAVESLYAAAWFGLYIRETVSWPGAVEMFLAGEDWRPAARTDTARLSVAAGLFGFAEHDSYYADILTGVGLTIEELNSAPRCPKCRAWIGIDCLCEEIRAHVRKVEDNDA